MREAVQRVAGRALTEASGNVTLETVATVAETGVDRISSGWITHSAPALDIGLDVVVAQAARFRNRQPTAASDPRPNSVSGSSAVLDSGGGFAATVSEKALSPPRPQAWTR